MKTFNKLFILSVLAVTTLAACSKPKEPTSESEEPIVSETETTPSEESSEGPTWIDYAHNGSIVLQYDYAGRDFYKDGIGQVTLKTAIDGDTAHFSPLVTTTSRENIKARFFGVDTPESTGKVQPYGRPASNFTKSKLLSADENGTIVVSSAQDGYGLPNPDSTGERYVSLVWIHETKKNAPFNELTLLNLWIVQEGLSWVKNVGDMPQYSDIFYAAEDQAEVFKKNLWSGEPDETFNYGEYQDASLLDIKIELEKTLKDPNYENPYDNQKIRVVGTIAGYSNHILYIQNFYTQEDGARSPEGEYAGINIFTGMSPIPSKYKKPNTYIQICGLAQNSETFGFQITDTEGHFPSVESLATENDCKILIKPDDNTDEFALHTFEYTASELSHIASTGSTENLFCSTVVTTTVKCSSVYINNAGDEFTLSFEGCSWEVYLTFAYKGDPNYPNYVWKEKSDFIGKSFNVKGIYTFHQYMNYNNERVIDFQIVVGSAADLVLVA